MASKATERTLIGKPPNHWMYDVPSSTFDLTRPMAPDFPLPSPGASISMTTTTKTILISPRTTALVIIDMQNYFLSIYLDKPADSAGNKAAERLLETAIPAAREAGIQIIWLNWGLTESDIEKMPPGLLRGFGFEASLGDKARTETIQIPAISRHGMTQGPVELEKDLGLPKVMTEIGRPQRSYHGLGSEIGSITVENGKVINAGRLLMRDTWNAALPPSLEAAYKQGQRLEAKLDVWIHKNRLSGF